MGQIGNVVKLAESAAGLAMNAKNAKDTYKNARGAAEEFHAADKKDVGRKFGSDVYNETADVGKTTIKTFLKTYEVIPRTVCRVAQFVLALVVCGFYGNRVSADREAGNGYSAEWIFAVLVGGVSAITALLFGLAAPLAALPYIGSRLKLFKTYRAYPWDLFLFLLWAIMFTVFGVIFMKRDSDNKYKGSSTGLMKTAMWVDLVNVLLWAGSAGWGALKVFFAKKADKAQKQLDEKLWGQKPPV